MFEKKKLIWAAGIVALLVAGVIIGLSRGTGYAVEAAGQRLAVAASQNAADKALREILAEKEAALGLPVRCRDEISYERISLHGRKALTADRLKQQLQGKLRLEAAGTAILVRGKAAVVVTDEGRAKQALQRVKETVWRELEVPGKIKVEKVDIKEAISYKKTWVSPERIFDPLRAARILRLGTDRQEKYTVAQGDTLWGISHRHNMTVKELVKANPALKGDHLALGQQLNLVVAVPYLTVCSVETQVTQEKVPFKETRQRDSSLYVGVIKVKTKGEPGIKESLWRVSRENGAPLGKTLVSQRVVQEPKAQIALVGTRSVPSRGTGRFIWPTRGKVTSPFGYRGKHYHEGLDIGVHVGTPVYAADTGIVTFAGRRSGYGNLVIIDHGNGFTTRYAHLSSYLVSKGDRVKKGEVIAKSGNTGRSTGPHLHFEIRVKGAPKNPFAYY